jgi:hypothetical protein
MHVLMLKIPYREYSFLTSFLTRFLTTQPVRRTPPENRV